MAGNWGSWRLSPFPRSPLKPGWTQDADSDLLGGSLCILSSDNSSSFTDRPVLKTVYLVLILFPSGLDSLWKCTENLTHENYLPTERDCNKWIRLPEPATTSQESDRNSSHGSWGVQPRKPWGSLSAEWWLSCGELSEHQNPFTTSVPSAHGMAQEQAQMLYHPRACAQMETKMPLIILLHITSSHVLQKAFAER